MSKIISRVMIGSFSLFETLCIMTVAVVGIVAVISIPNFRRSRDCCNCETAAVWSCKTYCTAQDIYRRKDYNNDGVLEYAQALSGNNSLYETKVGLGDVAMIDRSFANAEGIAGTALPKEGYCFKVLTKQGTKAPGGAKDFIKNGHMTEGYALVAYPAKYDIPTRNTYIVSNDGIVYQKNMGTATHSIVDKMTEYNPDETWVVAE